jgi:hypothetical protein
MGFSCQFVSVIRVLQSPLQMPVSELVFPFFIVFRSSSMSVCRKVMLLGRFPVRVV